MSCIICNGIDETNQGICPKCISQIRNDAEVIRVIKENCVSPAQPITREDALALLKEARNNDDTEHAHSVADDVLCDLLETLGYKDVVAAFHEVNKWYA
jgi:hypothetical protein